MSHPGPQRDIFQGFSGPAPDLSDRQRLEDNEHLQLLSIFYYISGALHGVGVIGTFIWFGMAANFLGAIDDTNPMREDDTAMTIFMLALGGLGALLGVAITAISFYAGWALHTRNNKTLVQIAAALNCLNVPAGTLLGVCTFVVLNRPSVQNQFDRVGR